VGAWSSWILDAWPENVQWLPHVIFKEEAGNGACAQLMPVRKARAAMIGWAQPTLPHLGYKGMVPGATKGGSIVSGHLL